MGGVGFIVLVIMLKIVVELRIWTKLPLVSTRIYEKFNLAINLYF